MDQPRHPPDDGPSLPESFFEVADIWSRADEALERAGAVGRRIGDKAARLVAEGHTVGDLGPGAAGRLLWADRRHARGATPPPHLGLRRAAADEQPGAGEPVGPVHYELGC